MTWVLGIIGWLRGLTWQQVLAGLAAVGAVLLYRKGRRDERAKGKVEDLENAHEIRRKADDARVAAARRAGELGDDDLRGELRKLGAWDEKR